MRLPAFLVLALVLAGLGAACDLVGGPGRAPTRRAPDTPQAVVGARGGQATPGTTSSSSQRLPTSTATPSVTPTPTPTPSRVQARVVRVWDGDTILIEGGLSVRYLGIKTPGAGVFLRPMEPYGPDAAQANQRLVGGATVELESDETDTSSEGFLLRYVHVNGVFVNGELVRAGLARADPQPPEGKYDSLLLALEEEARRVGRGMWSAGSARTVVATPSPAVAPTTRLPTTPVPSIATRLPATPPSATPPRSSPTRVPTGTLPPAR